jgi:hypothetical protein
MCTVTWVHEGDGYQLLCNRDEKRTRARAIAPQVQTRDAVRFIAPIDQDSGGTWIATNEFGVSLCLLNGANREPPRDTYTSRGLLVLELVTAQSATEVCERIWEFNLSVFAPFTLAVLEPGQCTPVIEWNGVEKAIFPYGQPFLPLTSSSFDPDGARAGRRADFLHRLESNVRLDAALLFAFHQSHGPGPDAHSPCMHRPDAETVSFSWVKVTDSEADFFYTPAAPCKGSPGENKRLLLRQ